MISENITAIRGRISSACIRAGRKPSEVTLVAVAKTFPGVAVREAVKAGVTDIGENYVQEALRVRDEINEEQIRWHFVGHLQRNKVRSIVSWIHMIHAVDTVPLIAEIDRLALQAGRVVECLLEVNTTGETSKHGIPPHRVMETAKAMWGYENVRLVGLMTIGPFAENPEASRPVFQHLRQLKDEVASIAHGNIAMQHLSMGMTTDFEVAIEEGATLIRIGTAIFGSRKRQINTGGRHETDTA